MKEFRHEYKYLIDDCQKEILKVRAKGLLQADKHADNDNQYIIRSMYLDNIGNELLKDNIKGNDKRDKYRIRYYNNDISRISFEKKSKIHGMCKKESFLLTLDEYKQILEGHIPSFKDSDSEVKKRILTEAKLKDLKPSIIVTYKRTPYIYPAGNVRITFDEGITSSNEFSKFLEGTYINRPVLEMGQSLLEVKWDELIPLHIKETMNLEGLTWTAFSKYLMCKIIHL